MAYMGRFLALDVTQPFCLLEASYMMTLSSYRLDVLGSHFNASAKAQLQPLLQVMRQIQAPSLVEPHMLHILLDKKAMEGTRNLHFLVTKPEVCVMHFMDPK
jgi:hypothetical protein